MRRQVFITQRDTVTGIVIRKWVYVTEGPRKATPRWIYSDPGQQQALRRAA